MIGLAHAGTFEAQADGWFTGEFGESWCQGRTVFGGLVVTAAARAMATRVDPGRSLRSVVVAFVGPVAAGRARIAVETLRAGSSLSFLSARVLQADKVRTLVTAGFGQGRAAGLRVNPAARPETPAPSDLEPMPFIEGLVPTFARHFDYRWTAAQAPFSGSADAHVQGWIRPRDEGPVDAAGLLSLIDAWPPPIITRAEAPVPLSSVTWQVNLLDPPGPEGIPPKQWWFFDSCSQAARDGYSDETASVWGPDGRLAATSRQLVADFPAPTKK